MTSRITIFFATFAYIINRTVAELKIRLKVSIKLRHGCGEIFLHTLILLHQIRFP